MSDLCDITVEDHKDQKEHEDHKDHKDNRDHKNHNDHFIDAKDHDEILEVTFGALSDLWPETPFLTALPACKQTWEIAGTPNF